MFTRCNTNVQEQRQKLKNSIDKFATFSWGGYNNLFDEFGLFIINNGNDLRFYNGPTFANMYSQGDLIDHATITGIKHQIHTLSFTVGMYYFTIDDYRRMLQCFNPYEINFLKFSFNPDWAYQCKLKSIQDSTRYVIGSDTVSLHTREPDTKDYTKERYYYYTEIKFSFDIQGEDVLYAMPYVWKQQDSWYQIDKSSIDNYHDTNNNIYSPLDFPFEITCVFIPTSTNANLLGQIKYDSSEPFQCFQITLANLKPGSYYAIRYNSQTGLILYDIPADTNSLTFTKLLTLATDNDNGQRLVTTLSTNQCLINGYDTKNCQLQVLYNGQPCDIQINSMARCQII